ncbi:amino acid adenylation domain-containing protein [Streptomyces sp. NPDC054933]
MTVPADSPMDETAVEEIRGLTPDERKAVVAGWLRERISRLGAACAEEIDGSAPLTAAGISSLRLLRLRAQLGRRFGVTPPMRVSSLDELASWVADALGEQREGGGEPDEFQIAADPGGRFEPFPLTDLQHAYLMGRSDAFELGSLGGHAYFELTPADLDVARLERAWQLVVERHGALRMTVLPDGRQQVADSVPPYRFEVLDLRGEPMEKAVKRLEEVRAKMSHEVFSLQQWPLFHIAVTRMPDGAAHVHFSIDLFIADLWALRVLLGDWWRLYEDPDAELPKLDLTFRDVVLAEHATRGSDAYQAARRYWDERLDELPPAPQLPANTAAATGHFTRRMARVPAPVWSRVKELAAVRGVTPSGVLLAAYSVVVGAWSSTQRFTVDVTLFNRPPVHPQINDLVGDFTNVDLLAIDLVDTDTFQDLADAVQQRLWADLQHAAAGGVQSLRELAARRGTGTAALAPVVFTSALGGDDDGFSSLFGGFGTPVHAITQTPQLYLDHQVFEEYGEAVLVWDTRDGVLPEGVLEDMFGAYQRLVLSLAEAEAWTRPPELELPGWQSEIRARVNDTSGPLPTGVLATRVLERAAAAESAQAPAVITAERALTFGELGRQAVGIARTLHSRGLGRGALVGVGALKGWRQIAAVLGVTAAGCTYVPVDPALPLARRAWMTEHAGVELLVTDGTPGYEWPAGLPCLAVDEVAPATAEELAEWQCPADPEDTAYVLYTSGSTGTPKGVAVSHRSVLNTLIEVNRRFDVGPDDRVLGLSSLSFDLSLYDTFGVLGAGGALVLPEPEAARDPARWLELMRSHRVTLWNSVPALMDMLVAYCEAHDATEPLPLRLVLMSGDRIPVPLPDRIRALGNGIQVIAAGGPTETSVWSNAYEVGEVDGDWASVPYGFPLRNHTLHVLNERLAPAPVWVPGPLYVSGAGLAAGYHRDPERTAQSFISHPETGERLYRTGDLARYRPDGCLEILGREDFQVKIGGFRIELGEIEHALTDQPEVEQAVVVAAASGDQRRLVGFVVPAPTAGHADPVGDDFGDIERDPMTRLRFKLSRPGLRELDGPVVALPGDPSTAAQRRSRRVFRAEPVPQRAFAEVLGALRAVEQDGHFLPRYAYGSPGALYPVQVYLQIRPGRVAGVAGGSYYYDPRHHALALCSSETSLPEELFASGNREVAGNAAFTVFLVAQRKAIDPLYGRVARDFCLLETGLITQLLETAAPRSGLGTCQLGATADGPALRAAFRLDEGHELLHTLVGGLPSEEETSPAAGDRDALVDVLRGRLTERLPSYLVPSLLVVLDQLPLSQRGKVDRQALIRRAELAETGSRVRQAPRDDTERVITEVVCEVLGLESAGATDNFMEIGAGSVHLTRMYGLLRDRLPQEFGLLALFEHPSPRALAEWLRGNIDDTAAVAAGRARAQQQRAARRRTTRRTPGTEE